jgi:hypothetical protein
LQKTWKKQTKKGGLVLENVKKILKGQEKLKSHLEE